jgi:hypothetical protein
MRRAALLLPALALVVLLAACGSQGQTSSADNFKDADQRAVAQKVEDLENAGKRNKPDDICSNILAKALVTQLDAAGTDCATEMKKAIEEANDFDLEVRKVTITGATATADVKRGKDGPTEKMEFARENGQWRATSLSGK